MGITLPRCLPISVGSNLSIRCFAFHSCHSLASNDAAHHLPTVTNTKTLAPTTTTVTRTKIVEHTTTPTTTATSIVTDTITDSTTLPQGSTTFTTTSLSTSTITATSILPTFFVTTTTTTTVIETHTSTSIIPAAATFTNIYDSTGYTTENDDGPTKRSEVLDVLNRRGDKSPAKHHRHHQHGSVAESVRCVVTVRPTSTVTTTKSSTSTVTADPITTAISTEDTTKTKTIPPALSTITATAAAVHTSTTTTTETILTVLKTVTATTTSTTTTATSFYAACASNNILGPEFTTPNGAGMYVGHDADRPERGTRKHRRGQRVRLLRRMPDWLGPEFLPGRLFRGRGL